MALAARSRKNALIVEPIRQNMPIELIVFVWPQLDGNSHGGANLICFCHDPTHLACRPT
jgi:hypothetical protein